jgi:hypothetical protein
VAWVETSLAGGNTLDVAIESAVRRLAAEGLAADAWRRFGGRVVRDLYWSAQRQRRHQAENGDLLAVAPRAPATTPTPAAATPDEPSAEAADDPPVADHRGRDLQGSSVYDRRDQRVYNPETLQADEAIYALVYEVNGAPVCLGHLRRYGCRVLREDRRRSKNAYAREEALFASIKRRLTSDDVSVRQVWPADELADLVRRAGY